MSSVSSFDYRSILDSFKARLLTEKEIEQRLSDLLLLFDFSASLSRAAGMSDLADLLLLTVMGYTASRRSVFLLKTPKGLETNTTRGYRKEAQPPAILPCNIAPPYPDYYVCDAAAEAEAEEEEEGHAGGGNTGGWRALCEATSVHLLIPVPLEGRLLGVVGVGEKMQPENLTVEQLQTLVSLMQIAASALQNAQTNEMVQTLNRQLILKVYQLNSLFELSKDFNAVWEQDAIFRIMGSSLIGQLLVSRCAVFTYSGKKLECRFVRGFRFPENFLQDVDLKTLLPPGPRPLVCSEAGDDPATAFCREHRVHIAFPMMMNEEFKGVIFLGEKRNRKALGQEDMDFIGTLSSLALVSDENARMQREMIHKQRMEKELSIARDIQFSLLPQALPEVPGYDVSSYFRPCYQVGGDYFDLIPVSASEIAVAIGDVSGKSTPAAMIMACLQSSLRTLASMKVTDPKLTIEQINNILCQSQSKKYVTFFYAILDFTRHQLGYVNAGHCYPLIVKKDGRVDRLESGGTVLGFFPDANYRSGSYTLDPGDLMFLYTDGVSESINDQEEEFGVERIIELLTKYRERSVGLIQEAIVSVIKEFVQNQQQSDDITFLLLKRT